LKKRRVFEMSKTVYQSTRRYISEKLKLRQHCCENLKSGIIPVCDSFSNRTVYCSSDVLQSFTRPTNDHGHPHPAPRTHIIRVCVWASFLSACVHCIIQNSCYGGYFWYINLHSYSICASSSCTI